MATAINPATAPLPEVVTMLRASVDSLPSKDQGFAYSLLSSAAMRGLSDKQATWLRKLASRAVNPEAEPQTVTVGDVSGLIALFDKAKASGLRWPKLRTLTADGLALTIKVAGEQSRNAGDLYVTSGKQETRVYFGRVDRGGVFHPSNQPEATALTACAAALRAMASDPAMAGKTYGTRTGNCAFCSLPLDDGRSVNVGYGPVCAERWGLPWGERPTKPARKSKAK